MWRRPISRWEDGPAWSGPIYKTIRNTWILFILGMYVYRMFLNATGG